MRSRVLNNKPLFLYKSILPLKGLDIPETPNMSSKKSLRKAFYSITVSMASESQQMSCHSEENKSPPIDQLFLRDNQYAAFGRMTS